MPKIFIKPAVDEIDGETVVRKVLMPELGHQPLPAAGLEVEESIYWIRRLDDGDVVKAEPPATPKKPKTTPPQES